MLQFAALTIKHPAFPGKIVSMSIGVSTMIPHMGIVPEIIVTDADEAMYDSKESGWDRITNKNHESYGK
ncbi:MAG: GGDEF domain-containing protein [Bacteroidetes bacterium]|nr:GGDEF domain-containing protein [Bacteroidota bacterium]